MQIHIIKTEEDYKVVLKFIDELLETNDAEELEKLELFSMLVENYEEKFYKIENPDPIAAIIDRTAQLGLTNKDLEKYIGSRGRVSEILNKKRTLTLPMISRLNKNLNIPADILIQEINKKIA